MEMLIPLIIVAFIVIHVIMYAFTIFLRRHFMLPLVEKFLAREDASLLQKSMLLMHFKMPFQSCYHFICCVGTLHFGGIKRNPLL